MDIVEDNTFESTTRYEAASLEYPKIIWTTRMTFLSKQPKTSTDVINLSRMPSQSSCQEMKDLCKGGNYVGVSCDLGTLTLESIEVVLDIHRLRDVKSDVLKEEKWLTKEINVPSATCSYSKEHLASHFDKIFNTPNNHSVLTHHRGDWLA